MQNTMLIMLLVLATQMKGHHSVPCPGDNNFHTETHNNTCYLISFKAAAFKQSYEFCRKLGGYLTDMEENRSSFFKDLAASNNLYYKKKFWIGLLWTTSLGAPVWDSGRAYTRKDVVASIFDIGRCARYTLQTETWEWVICFNAVENFICSLESLAVTSETPDPCDQVCSKIKSKDTVKPTTPAKEKTINKPEETDECINMSSKNCVCIGKQKPNFSNNTSSFSTIKADATLEFVLSLTTAVCLAMNIVMGIVICWVVIKNRRLIRQKTRPVLDVDILKLVPFPTPDPHSESKTVEGLARQISTGFERDASINNDTEETAYSDIDQVQNEIVKSLSCNDAAGDTQTLDDPQVVTDAPSISNPQSTYNHLRINNGLSTKVDTVYGDNSANKPA